RPLGINALLAIDDFSSETGGTHVLPFSHKLELLPSQAYLQGHEAVVTAAAGSAIIFDVMMFHRAGSNRSPAIRRAVNHLYTTPIIKQQYDFPRAINEMAVELDPSLERLLGLTSQVPLNDRA